MTYVMKSIRPSADATPSSAFKSPLKVSLFIPSNAVAVVEFWKDAASSLSRLTDVTFSSRFPNAASTSSRRIREFSGASISNRFKLSSCKNNDHKRCTRVINQSIKQASKQTINQSINRSFHIPSKFCRSGSKCRHSSRNVPRWR